MNEQARKSVVITGASSGIGRACALLLAERGFRVFAGVRKARDAEALQRDDRRIEPIMLDVTDAPSIAAAVETVRVRVGERGLDGLVNNAGIGVAGPVEYMSAEALRRQFDVNVFGAVATTQAFLPLLRSARGRIVNMGSIGDRITIPFGGALCATKCALRALNDALRLELHPSGIHVSLVEPASIRTPAIDKTLGDADEIVRGLPAEGAARYGDKLREFMKRGRDRESAGSPPEVVARAVHHALTSRRPRLRYPVGADAWKLLALPKLVPERLLDLIRLRLFGMPSGFGAELAAFNPEAQSPEPAHASAP